MSDQQKGYGVAVIACGDRGAAHANAWAKLDNVSIRAVTDIDRQRANDLAQQHGAEIAPDWKAAIDRDDVDIVSVCTPAGFHPEPMIFAADCGKHVLCEKPMALTLEDGASMIAAAERNGVKLTFSFQNQYSQVTEKLRELMDAAEIGRPVMARQLSAAEIRPKLAMHSKAGNNGPVNDVLCHAMTLWRYIFRSDPVRVQASGLTIAKDSETLKPVADVAVDTAAVVVTFASGDIALYSVTWGLPRGTKGGVYQDMVGPEGVLKPAGHSITMLQGAEETTFADLARGGDNAQTAAFLKCIEDDLGPINTGRDAYVALQTSLAALESIETGQAVEIVA